MSFRPKGETFKSIEWWRFLVATPEMTQRNNKSLYCVIWVNSGQKIIFRYQVAFKGSASARRRLRRRIIDTLRKPTPMSGGTRPMPTKLAKECDLVSPYNVFCLRILSWKMRKRSRQCWRQNNSYSLIMFFCNRLPPGSYPGYNFS